MLKRQKKGIFSIFLFSLLLIFTLSGGVFADQWDYEYVLTTLPGSETVLPYEFCGTEYVSPLANPCYVTVPAGTTQITIKENPDEYYIGSVKALAVYDAAGNAFPADAGAGYSVTVPATATRENPYLVSMTLQPSRSKTMYLYCVEENAPNPFITATDGTYANFSVLEGSDIELNVSGLGDPAQEIEWYYGYCKDDSWERTYEKLEGESGESLNLAASQDSLELGCLDETYGYYYLAFYAKVGEYVSNTIHVLVNETSITGAKSLDASSGGGYTGASQWLNVGATFGNTVAAETPVKFYLTATENGAADTAIAGTLVETTVGNVPATATQEEKAMGFLVAADLTAGDYWLAIQLGSDDPFYRYESFTVYADASAYIKAALDRMVGYYGTKGFLSADGTYVGLSLWSDTGTDWKAWMFPNYGYTLESELLAGVDGKTYVDGLEARLSYLETNELEESAKGYYRYVAALTALGQDPRDFNGRNLVVALLNCAYNDDGTLCLDENGALDVTPDILATSYLLLGAEIAGATEAEGYTQALQEAGIKAILPTVETSVNATSTDDIASTDWLAMQSYPLYFLQDNETYGERITTAIGKMAAMVSGNQFANGGLSMSWPGAQSEGSFDDPLSADDYATNTNSMAVMLSALALFGSTSADLADEVWQEESGTLLTAILSLQMEDGSMGFNGQSNDMATYQTLGALIDLVQGKSCFVNANETYLATYPDYAEGIVDPFISDGSAARLSAAEATVTFTTNEAGKAYYAAVNSGEAAPTVDTSGAGIACNIGENTIAIDDLADYTAKDVYVLVKDNDGNVSKTLKLALAAGDPPVEIPDFTDVNEDDWFYEDVIFAVQNGIFKGTSATAFSPKENITRGQFVTILGRYAGIEDTPAGATVSTKFTDVKGGAYYASHVAWAVKEGIVFGISADKFAPEANISREDMATMIYRFAEAMDIDLPDGDVDPVTGELFADDDDIAAYAKAAVYSMKATEIIKGVGNNKFAPDEASERAEAAAIIHRLMVFAEAD